VAAGAVAAAIAPNKKLHSWKFLRKSIQKKPGKG